MNPSRQTFFNFRRVTIQPGDTVPLSVTGSFINFTESDAAFEFSLDGRETVEATAGFSFACLAGDFFRQILLKNPSNEANTIGLYITNGRVYSSSAAAAGDDGGTVAEALPVFYGKSTEASAGEADILAMTTVSKTSAAGSYSYEAGSGYLYLVTPAVWSGPTALTVSGLPLSLASASPFDTAFGALTCGVTSVNAELHRVFRSYNQVAGAVTVTAT